jgi:hypothetical protein
MITVRALSTTASPGLANQTELDRASLRKHAGLERNRDLEGALGMEYQRVRGAWKLQRPVDFAKRVLDTGCGRASRRRAGSDGPDITPNPLFVIDRCGSPGQRSGTTDPRLGPVSVAMPLAMRSLDETVNGPAAHPAVCVRGAVAGAKALAAQQACCRRVALSVGGGQADSPQPGGAARAVAAGRRW